MNVQFVYMTAADTEEARKIGKHLVGSKLAACVNIIDRMSSIYIWEGAVQEDREVVLIAKTTQDRMGELVSAVTAMHSYECPCIVSLPAAGGNRDFLDWIASRVE